MAECLSDESFFTAIRQGEVEVVKAVIETRGRSILAQMTHWETMDWPNLTEVEELLYPIHVACKELHLDLVKLFIDINGDCANQKTEYQRFAPLTFACGSGSRPLYDLLMERSATTDYCDEFDLSLLHWASYGGNLHLVKDLFKRGQSLTAVNQVDETPFHKACRGGHSKVLEFMYEKDPQLLFAKGWNDWTGLHVTAVCNRVFATKWLLEKGLNIDQTDESGYSPLMLASEYGSVETVECLLDQGCANDITDKIDNTVFHIAARPFRSDEKRKSLIILRLMKERVKADVKNKEGKYPHHYLSGDLRLIVRSYWYKEHYAPLYGDGEVDADRMKLCIMGDERVGKTTMAIAMGCDGDPTKRTAGIEVHKVNKPEFHGPVVVYDVAGHKEFHRTHSFFLGGIATMFAHIINSSLSLAEILAIVRYWLAFVVSSRHPGDLSGYRPYMLTIGSHGDTEESKRKQQLQLSDAMKIVQQEFSGHFTFVRIKDAGDEFLLVDDPSDDDEDFVVLDCRDKDSLDMRKLMRLIGKVREKCLQLVPKVPIVCKVIRDGVLAERRLQEKCQEKEEFRALAVKQSDLLKGEEEFDLLIEYLTENGEIVDFEGKLVLDVIWLCLFVIGAVIADRESGDFHVSLQPEDDGSVTKQAIGEAFRRFSKSRGVPFTYDVMWGIDILCHLSLCLEHPTRKDVYIFPCHIKKGRPLTAWEKDSTTPVYVGRRVQCTSHQQIITPGSFPVIQCEAKKSRDMLVAELWDGGMKVKPKNTPHLQGVEALVEIPDKSRSIHSIDVIIHGPVHSQGDCMQFLDSIMHLIMQVLDKKSPGTSVQWCYLSHSQLTQHISKPDCYTEEEVKTAMDSSQDYVTHESVQDRLLDLLVVSKDHILLLPSNMRSDLSEALDFPEEGQPGGRKLSKGLGIRFRHNTSEVLDKWSVDMKATVTHLIDVLKRLDPPAVDAVGALAERYEAARGFTPSTQRIDSPPKRPGSCFSYLVSVCLPMFAIDPDSVLAAVQRHGSDQWYDIGKKMGFSHSDLMSNTKDIPHYSSKLSAIFDIMVNKVGQEESVTSLLEACQKIPSPIHGIVVEMLRESQRDV